MAIFPESWPMRFHAFRLIPGLHYIAFSFPTWRNDMPKIDARQQERGSLGAA